MDKIKRTYSFSIKVNDFIFELAKECGAVYSNSLSEFWRVFNEQGIWLSKFDLQKHMNDKISRNFLHSDSFIAAMQQVHANLASWKQAKKVCDNAKPPSKSRFLQSIRFKKSQIRFVDGYIVLSLGKNKEGEKEYFKVKWNKNLPLPLYGNISYSKSIGWKLNLVVEVDYNKKEELDINNIMSIDLGNKRIATLFDGDNVVVISGKKLKALTHYQNKINSKKQADLAKKKKGSKREKRLRRSWRRKNDKIQLIKKDIINKTSKLVVDYAVEKNIGKIVFGDCSGIHTNTNFGKKNNQQVQQGLEMKLARNVENKFKDRGGISEYISEAYTSQECPKCKHRKKQSSRVYKCKECGYVYDRDGVGAINIMERIISKNVSFDRENFIKRISCMAQPCYIKLGKTQSYNMLFANSLQKGKSEKPSYFCESLS